LTIIIPVSDKPPTPLPQEDKSFITGKGTILLVDDELLILDVGARMIEHLGYNVLRAASGKEALEVYRDTGPEIDLVLLDMVMPGMGGKEVFEELQALDPEVRVLLSSGYSLESGALDIMNRGCVGFLQKPFDVKSLSEKIRDCLNT
jgi:two-component system, cell cycle sensor histidine kinase and response regulator CckA